MSKKTMAIILLLSIALIFGVPLVIDWLIIGNSFPSNIENSDWVGFLGGYIGALIGAAFSLIGIIITIRYTSQQNKQDRELQIRPYCTIRHVHSNSLSGTNKVLGELPITWEPKKNSPSVYTSILYIKNIGLGPAIEFEFDIDEFDDGREHCFPFMQKTGDASNYASDSLQPNEEAAFLLCFNFNFDKISEDSFIENEKLHLDRYIVKSETLLKYRNFEIVLHIRYHDMLKNTYYQKVKLSSHMYIEGYNEAKQAEHKCEVQLKEVTAPVKE